MIPTPHPAGCHPSVPTVRKIALVKADPAAQVKEMGEIR